MVQTQRRAQRHQPRQQRQVADQLLAEIRAEARAEVQPASPAISLLSLRAEVTDGTLLDWLELSQLVEAPGTISVRALRERWACSQSQVSRRMQALQRAGLADITPGWGAYQVHAVRQWEVPA